MEKLDLVEITGPSCGVCKMIKGIVEKVVSEFPKDRLNYREICVQDDESMAFAAKHNVRSVPVFLFLDGDRLLTRHDGAINYNELKRKIQENLDK